MDIPNTPWGSERRREIRADQVTPKVPDLILPQQGFNGHPKTQPAGSCRDLHCVQCLAQQPFQGRPVRGVNRRPGSDVDPISVFPCPPFLWNAGAVAGSWAVA